MVEAALKADAANIRAAGYNFKSKQSQVLNWKDTSLTGSAVLVGPETPISKLEERMQGIHWEATGVGYGERGAKDSELTAYFTEIVNLFKKVSPDAPIVFNRSPNTTLEALARFAPITGNCDHAPGKDLVSGLLDMFLAKTDPACRATRCTAMYRRFAVRCELRRKVYSRCACIARSPLCGCQAVDAMGSNADGSRQESCQVERFKQSTFSQPRPLRCMWQWIVSGRNTSHMRCAK